MRERTSPVIIIGSERSEVGLPAAMALLCDGGAAVDAVEVALRLCKDNLADPYVGTGGLPNAGGDTELDASLVIGSSRAFGAVKGFPSPLSTARAVMEKLPQPCLLAGARKAAISLTATLGMSFRSSDRAEQASRIAGVSRTGNLAAAITDDDPVAALPNVRHDRAAVPQPGRVT